MIAEKQTLSAVDQHRIFLRKWYDKTRTPRGCIHINHGMAEHSQRYQPIAEQLVAAGFVVFAHDHRGHGHSIPQGGLVGHYADRNGWSLVVSDLLTVNRHIREQYPQLPVVLIGHSMGSFIVQSYCLKYGDTVDAVILSGSAFTHPRLIKANKILVKMERLRSGPRGRSNLIDHQTFGAFNKHFGKPRTEADWLTRNESEVDKYLTDPLCGFICTNQLWHDFVSGLESISDSRNLKSIPDQVPFLLISGERDPLSFHRTQHGITRLAKLLESCGQNDVDYKLYPDGRHEIFNEINREEVVSDVIDWIDSKLEKFPGQKQKDHAYA